MAPAMLDRGGSMFNNLIESSSHKREFKRRGSFFLFTTATYAVLFVIAGVASIYAYDARLEDQNLESITMLNPLELATTQPPRTTHNAAPPRSNNSTRQNYAERQTAMASVNHPEIAPDTVSAKPNTSLPVPDTGLYRITGRDVDPSGPAAVGPEHGTGSDLSSRAPVIDIGTPPPAVVAKPAPVISKGVINGQALSLPKPAYPPIARQLKIQGMVNVQVLINETGKVVSAKAISGNPALMGPAQNAAFGARFSPTFLGDQPVKVSGVITYNFVLQ
jgi:protein TonB